MARNYKQPSIVSGLSVEDILNMDFDKFNELGAKDMKLVVGRLVSAANKRIRRLESAGIESPAYRQVMRSGGYISTQGKDLNALRSEFARARNFLESKTSSRTGYKKVRKETIANLKKEGVEIDPAQFDEVFNLYERLKEIDPSISNRTLKYAVLSEIASMPDTLSIEEKTDLMRQKLVQLYEERAELENGSGGVSDFFEFE